MKKSRLSFLKTIAQISGEPVPELVEGSPVCARGKTLLSVYTVFYKKR